MEVKFNLSFNYEVPDGEVGEDIYNRDVKFFEEIEKQFKDWRKDKSEKRVPLKFDLKHEKITAKNTA